MEEIINFLQKNNNIRLKLKMVFSDRWGKFELVFAQWQKQFSDGFRYFEFKGGNKVSENSDHHHGHSNPLVTLCKYP
jgi:hypothetical protein